MAAEYCVRLVIKKEEPRFLGIDERVVDVNSVVMNIGHDDSYSDTD